MIADITHTRHRHVDVARKRRQEHRTSLAKRRVAIDGKSDGIDPVAPHWHRFGVTEETCRRERHAIRRLLDGLNLGRTAIDDFSSEFPIPALEADQAQLCYIAASEDDGRANWGLQFLSTEERTRADSFRRAGERAVYIAVHAASRIVLARHRAVSPEAIELATDASGKLRFRDGAGPFFSLSRSSGAALVGVAASDIGVDIEAVGAVGELDLVARTYFAPEETFALERLSGRAREEAFYACWTRKEAFVKAVGLGLAYPLDSVRVGVEPTSSSLSLAGDDAEADAWSLWSELRHDLCAAAAVRHHAARFQVVRLGVWMPDDRRLSASVSAAV